MSELKNRHTFDLPYKVSLFHWVSVEWAAVEQSGKIQQNIDVLNLRVI